MDTDAEKLGDDECAARAAVGDGLWRSSRCSSSSGEGGAACSAAGDGGAAAGPAEEARCPAAELKQVSSNLSPPNRAFGVACAPPFTPVHAFAPLSSAYAPVIASGPPFAISDARLQRLVALKRARSAAFFSWTTTFKQCVARVFGGEICCCPLVEARIDLHAEGSNQQDAYQDEVVHTQVAERRLRSDAHLGV
jgi:hypothetical protein